MGAFHIGCKVENHVNRNKSISIAKTLVDTGSAHTWISGGKLEQIGVIREKKDIR